MRRYGSDEYNFDPALEDGTDAERVNEYSAPGKEFNEPPVFRETAPEFYGDAVIKQRDREDEKKKSGSSRHELLKRMFLVPLASAVAVVSITLASVGSDPLGSDFLMGSGSSSSAPADTSSAATDTSDDTTAPD
ncbi:MAG: hypothetical protein IJR90_09105, partial [Clostridia bacterium]|nr:hypothetical protein [Clostridia bacterium]